MRIKNVISQSLVVDVGSYYTRIASPEKGSLLNQRSQIALNTELTPVAVGDKAAELWGRAPNGIKVCNPIKASVISDFEAAESMLKIYLKQAFRNLGGFGIYREAILAVPETITEVEAMALNDIVKSCGVRKTYLVGQASLAAYAGHKATPQACLYVNIGAGTTNVAIVAGEHQLFVDTIKFGGESVDQEIQDFILHKYNLRTSIVFVRDLKHKIVDLGISKRGKNYSLSGQDQSSKLPKSVEIEPTELREPVSLALKSLTVKVSKLIEQQPADVVADLAETGLVLSGGTSNINGIDQLFAQATKLPVKVAEQPDQAVIEGGLFLSGNQRLVSKLAIDQDLFT